jgi:uncharacterized protein YjdB
VSGIRSLCSGSNTTFTTTGTGGSWISSNTTVATVNSSGLVTGVGVGRAIISYSISASCGAVIDTQEIEIITKEDIVLSQILIKLLQHSILKQSCNFLLLKCL